MTKTEKKKLIAKDVLYRIRTGKIVATSGAYFCVDEIETDGDKQAQYYAKKQNNCQVCAIGAATLCAITKFNRCTVDQFNEFITCLDFDQADQLTDFLSPYFTELELRMMEAFFENDNYLGFKEIDLYLEEIDYFQRYNETERLTRIFNHIAKHGKFDPKVFVKENGLDED